jgi:hypothetical protein
MKQQQYRAWPISLLALLTSFVAGGAESQSNDAEAAVLLLRGGPHAIAPGVRLSVGFDSQGGLKQVMNQRQLASVLFAVLGVFMAATRLPDLLVHAAIVMQWDPAMEDPAGPISPRAVSTFAVVATLIVVLMGLGLVVLRDRIADRLFTSAPGHTPSSEVQAVAPAVLGVYFTKRTRSITRLREHA